jgi:opacity protein-like surface antigen
MNLVARLFTVTGAGLAIVSCSALSAEPGFYFGVLGGQADYKFDVPAPLAIGRFPGVVGTPSLPIAAFDPTVSLGAAAGVVSVFIPYSATWRPTDDDGASAFGAFAGYRIMRYAAVELSYLNLGTLKRQSTLFTFLPTPGGDYTVRDELATTGASASALGILPITESWSVYARAGAFFANTELTSSFAGSESSIAFGSQDFTWGAGTQLDWGKHWSVRLDYQRFESVGDKRGAGEADVELLNLGVLFRI